MNYLVLAAGKGTRMSRLSTYLQKCMYPILDRPFLELVLESIVSNRRFDGARDRIVLVLGQFSSQIEGYFGGSWRGLPIQYVVQEEALGTAHAVAVGSAACLADDPTIVVQGDVWAEPEFFEAMVDEKLPDALSVVRHECAETHNERVEVAGGLVTLAWMGAGPFVECGIWKFSPRMIGYMMKRRVDEYRALPAVQAAIEDGVPVAAVERERWIHLGGTEPSVEANLRAVTAFFMAR
jgi:NDP-sugar pyrophosphorylase family protein